MALNNKTKVILGIVIFGAFAVAVEAYIGWRELLAPWRELAPGAIALILLLTGVTYGLRTLRFFDYFYSEMRGRFLLCLLLLLRRNYLYLRRFQIPLNG